MRRRPLILPAAACVLSLAAVGLYAAAKPSREGTASSSARPPTASEPYPALTGARSPGRGISVDDAMKALDLLRPRPRPAIDFRLPVPGQGTWRLADQRGKVVLLNFWATWCPPCLEEMPAMERLWRRYRDHDFALVAVSVDTDARVVPPFLKRHGLTFPVALDRDMDVSERYGVRALPSSFLIDRDGTLVGIAIGPRPWDNAGSHALLEAMARR